MIPAAWFDGYSRPMAVLALERSQAGQVRLLGEEFSNATRANLHRLRRAIQVVFQDPYGSFDPKWTV